MTVKRRKVYELRICGVLVCRGYIDECAEALGISESSMRGYLDGRSPRWAELRALPTLFMLGGEPGFVGTKEECAAYLDRNAQSVLSSCSKGIALAGHSITRIEYERFALPASNVDALIESARLERKHIR